MKNHSIYKSISKEQSSQKLAGKEKNIFKDNCFKMTTKGSISYRRSVLTSDNPHFKSNSNLFKKLRVTKSRPLLLEGRKVISKRRKSETRAKGKSPKEIKEIDYTNKILKKKYIVIKKIANGSTCEVLLAKVIESGEYVIIKAFSHKYTSNLKTFKSMEVNSTFNT